MDKNILILIITFFVLTGCKKEIPVKFTGEAQGTYYMIKYYDHDARNFQKEIDSLLVAFDKSVSLWVDNSLISRVNKNDTTVVPDNYFLNNFRLSQQVAIETNGAFDFSIGPLIKAWGFGKKGVDDIDSTHIDSILDFTGFNKIDIIKNKIVKEDPRVQINFNAIAQGYSVDMISDYLRSKNIPSFIVDIGGEVYANGIKPDGTLWKVGIEKPTNNATDERVLNVIIELENKSVATSGNYRKYIEKNGSRYSHIIDPKTGYPAMQNLLSATIVHKNTALADAYATACMVMGLEKAIEFVNSRQDMEAYFIYYTDDKEYATFATDGFEALIEKEN